MSILDNVPTEDDFISAMNEFGTLVDVMPETLVELTRKAMKYAYYRKLKDAPIDTVMTASIISVSPAASVQEAVAQMLKHHISGLPVIDAQEVLVGLITEADVLRSIGLPSDRPSKDVWDTMSAIFHHFSTPESIPNLQDNSVTVSDIMSKDVVTTSPANTVRDVLDLMQHNKIKRVLVTSDHDRVEGIVSRSDLMKVVLSVHATQ